MQSRKTVSSLLPYLVAVALFITIPMLYFAPQYEGKQLPMHDVTQYQGMSRDINEHITEFGEDPQWTGAMFGGMPSYQISIRHPSAFITKIFTQLRFIGDPAAFIFLAMLGFYIMMLLWGVNPWVGIVPSLAYGLSTYFPIIIGAGHVNKMLVLAYIPMLLGAVFHTFRGNKWLGAALTALFGSVVVAANHPQIVYYFLFVIGGYWINELVVAAREKTLPRFAKATGLLFAAAVLIVGSNLGLLYYTATHTAETTRGGTELTTPGGGSANAAAGLGIDYITAWSYGQAESFNMFIPGLTGGASDGGFTEDGAVAQALRPYGAARLATQLPGYWGDQPMTAGPTYIGAMVIFLAVAALFVLRGREKWWILIVTALAVLLAWGHNMMWFTELFYNYFPLYNKFRVVAMILVIVQWSAPFLMALLLHRLWKQEINKKEIFHGVKWALIVTGGVALFFALAGRTLFDFGHDNAYALMMQISGDNRTIAAELADAIVAERAAMLRADALRSLLLVVLTAGVVMVYAAGKLKKGWMLAAMGVLVCADLIPVDLRFVPQSKFAEPQHVTVKPTAADLQIMADPELGFRVFNLTVDPFNDATTSYFHRSVGGYHGAKLQRYQDLIERHLSRMNPEAFNMLNVKYFIQRDPQTGEPVAHENPDAHGAAWFVDGVVVAATPDEEIAALDTLDTRREMVVDERFAEFLTVSPTTLDTASYIRLTDYRPNRLTYEYYASEDTYAVFSEIYFRDGWTAAIDGRPADYFRANYLLRAMALPAGEHTVVFSFRAPHFRTVSAVTLVFSILIVVSVVAAAAWAIHAKRKQNAGQQ